MSEASPLEYEEAMDRANETSAPRAVPLPDFAAALDELLLESAAGSTSEEIGWSCMSFRLRLLEACGFDPQDALSLAIRPEIGLERPLGLVRNGCSPGVAAAILL